MNNSVAQDMNTDSHVCPLNWHRDGVIERRTLRLNKYTIPYSGTDISRYSSGYRSSMIQYILRSYKCLPARLFIWLRFSWIIIFRTQPWLVSFSHIWFHAANVAVFYFRHRTGSVPSVFPTPYHFRSLLKHNGTNEWHLRTDRLEMTYTVQLSLLTWTLSWCNFYL